VSTPRYKLLTPGPLTTTATVKQAMLVDHCTWDDDYKSITRDIRRRLLAIAGVAPASPADPGTYTTVLLQGSGTYGVEAVLSSVVAETDLLLICANGAYGERMVEICRWNAIPHVVVRTAHNSVPSADAVEAAFADHPGITHVAMVHCETTTGILNEVAPISAVTRAHGATFILDAMSSFGAVPIDLTGWGIDYLISSANKCLQGVPGFVFVIARTAALVATEHIARSLSLNLYAQWQAMEADGKWRFTSPTQVVLAFAQALAEFVEEGGVAVRGARYAENQRVLTAGMSALGFRPWLDRAVQSPIITTFGYPEGVAVDFADMYGWIKERGYAIYPGKLTEADTFRIGSIGEVDADDMRAVCGIVGDYLRERAGSVGGGDAVEVGQPQLG